MYIRGLIPRNSAELAEVVPIEYLPVNTVSHDPPWTYLDNKTLSTSSNAGRGCLILYLM